MSDNDLRARLLPVLDGAVEQGKLTRNEALALLDDRDRLRTLEAGVEALLRPRLVGDEDGMVQHDTWSHSLGLQCNECPGFPHADCVHKASLRALLATRPANEPT